MKLTLALLAASLLLLAGCSQSPSTHASGPTPLQTPNGAPPENGLHGMAIPGELFFAGRLYAVDGVFAYVRLTDKRPRPPLPAFLQKAGNAVTAGREAGSSQPVPDSGVGFLVYSIRGASPSRAIVMDVVLVGPRHPYWVFVRYTRK
jgi:hypothetical protein